MKMSLEVVNQLEEEPGTFLFLFFFNLSPIQSVTSVFLSDKSNTRIRHKARKHLSRLSTQFFFYPP